MTRPVKVFFGGTFDPVHIGHLRIGVELAEALQVSQVSLMPCFLPVHKAHSARSAAQRLDMLNLATAGCPSLVVDDREICRQTPSYTIDTLQSARDDYGSEASLVIVVGDDAFAGFRSWKDWQTIPQLAHIVVVTRPGYAVAPVPEELDVKVITQNPCRTRDYIQSHHAGSLSFLSLAHLSVSSSEIRQRLGAGKSVKYLLPDSVVEYIAANHLYL